MIFLTKTKIIEFGFRKRNIQRLFRLKSQIKRETEQFNFYDSKLL